MTAYAIDYKVRNENGDRLHSIHVDAKDLKSAKKKIGKKHGYKTGNMIKIEHVIICGYY